MNYMHRCLCLEVSPEGTITKRHIDR